MDINFYFEDLVFGFDVEEGETILDLAALGWPVILSSRTYIGLCFCTSSSVKNDLRAASLLDLLDFVSLSVISFSVTLAGDPLMASE